MDGHSKSETGIFFPTRSEFGVSLVPNDVGFGPGIVHDASQLDLLVLVDFHSRPGVNPGDLDLGRGQQDPDPSAGPDGLLSGRRADLALVDGVVFEGGVDDVEAVDARGIVAQDAVAGEAGKFSVVA